MAVADKSEATGWNYVYMEDLKSQEGIQNLLVIFLSLRWSMTFFLLSVVAGNEDNIKN